MADEKTYKVVQAAKELRVDPVHMKDVKAVAKEVAEEVVVESGESGKDVLAETTYVYDSENDSTIITFPKGVLPLRLELWNYDDGENRTCYFNTLTGMVVDENNNEIGEFEYNDKERAVIEIFVKVEKDPSDALIYCGWSQHNDGINSLYMFHPELVGGTKLYKHTLTDRSYELDEYEIITNSVLPLTSKSNWTRAQQGLILCARSGEVFLITDIGDTTLSFQIMKLDSSTGNYTNYSAAVDNYSDITDEVTEL